MFKVIGYAAMVVGFSMVYIGAFCWDKLIKRTPEYKNVIEAELEEM